jgi:predicted permease
MRLVIWVFFPALIFSRVCNNKLLNSSAQAGLYLGTGFMMITGGIFIGRLLAHLLKFEDGIAKRTFAYSAGINNFGYLGIPITAALFDQDVVGVLLVHNVGVEAAVWTVGVAYLSGKKGWGGFKNLLQPMTLSLALALGLNFIGWGDSAPIAFIAHVLNWIGQCAIPVGTILTGIYFHETMKGYQFFAEKRITLGIILARWILIPTALILVAAYLIKDPELRKVMLVQAAMPAGIFSFLIVEMYKGDVPIALRCSVFTMAFCPLITPLWLYLGSLFLGM